MAKKTTTALTAENTAETTTALTAETEETTTETEVTAVETEETAAETEETTAETEEEQVTKVYIGPSIPFQKLRSSMILSGTEAEISAFLSELLTSYPEIGHLLVEPEKLHEAMDKVERKGTILHKYYEDTLAKIRASRTNGG